MNHINEYMDESYNCRLSIVNCQFKPQYRQLCQTEASIPIFSRDWWLDVVCGEKHWDVILIIDKDRILAAMPVYIPNRGNISMPSHTQTMGPWFAPETRDTKYTKALGKRQELCKKLIEQLRPYPHFLQNFNYRVTDWLPFYWEGFHQTTRYTYLLKNIKQQEILWENMSANIRRNITKAREKHHIKVKKGITTDDFLQVQAQTFERQKIKIKEDINKLKELITVCRNRGQGDLWGGFDEKGQLHAAIFVVWQEDSAYYLAGGGNPGLRDSGAHSLVLWESIRYVSRFTDTFDLEGSMIPGVERFFREFGAIQTPFFTISKGNLSLIHKAWFKLTGMLNR